MRRFHRQSGTAVTINVADITAVEARNQGCRVLLRNGSEYDLRETVEQVQGAVASESHSLPGMITRDA